MKWYLKVLKNYATIKGRARRQEYWTFALISFGIGIVFTTLDLSLGLTFNNQGVLSGIYSVLILIPSICVGVRRMHDVGKSGWFLLIPIYNLILAFTEGQIGENKYGRDPKLEI